MQRGGTTICCQAIAGTDIGRKIVLEARRFRCIRAADDTTIKDSHYSGLILVQDTRPCLLYARRHYRCAAMDRQSFTHATLPSHCTSRLTDGSTLILPCLGCWRGPRDAEMVKSGTHSHGGPTNANVSTDGNMKI